MAVKKVTVCTENNTEGSFDLKLLLEPTGLSLQVAVPEDFKLGNALPVRVDEDGSVVVTVRKDTHSNWPFLQPLLGPTTANLVRQALEHEASQDAQPSFEVSRDLVANGLLYLEGAVRAETKRAARKPGRSNGRGRRGGGRSGRSGARRG